MRRTVLRIEGLEKTFRLHAIGRTVAGLGGVDLEVLAGDHVALVGPSGAGKSSLLKCIHRSYLPTAGRIVLFAGAGNADRTGIDLTALGDREMADARSMWIGYVSQFLRSEPRRGVLDVVVGAAMRRGLEAEDAEVAGAAVLTQLGISEDLWDTYPSLLSGGEQQRINLAAGTVAPPMLLLLDEPVSALDPANRAAVLARLSELRSDGVTVVSVFHDLDAIRRTASRVVVMQRGFVVSDTGVEEGLSILGDLKGVPA